ncbi:MAG: Fe-S protein assembly co-chaperone HscB [Saprospiraceae bacterium]|nr:Fe-S protein assembly co-chaperone HscB [Saprospiraceae bacterium]
MNYFELYGIPVSFVVDEPALRRTYYQNSKKYHPDFHTQADAQQQAEMLELATLNTKAFQTLSDPDRRMRYVLESNGLLSDEGSTPALPQAFLMDMMEINEQLMEQEMAFDPDRQQTIEKTLETLEKELQAAVQPVLDRYTAENGSRADLETVLDFFLKKRYLLRIQENLSKFAPRAGMAEW